MKKYKGNGQITAWIAHWGNTLKVQNGRKKKWRAEENWRKTLQYTIRHQIAVSKSNWKKVQCVAKEMNESSTNYLKLTERKLEEEENEEKLLKNYSNGIKEKDCEFSDRNWWTDLQNKMEDNKSYQITQLKLQIERKFSDFSMK